MSSNKYIFKIATLLVLLLFLDLRGYSKTKRKYYQKSEITKTPVVPRKIKFAGMKLYLNETARARVQDKVDSLTRWNFDDLLFKADLFFPIFDKIFKEEQIPDDLKFLAIQESLLSPNCISETNDYGIWAFQDMTAIEVGMQVNKHIDERLNIISATKGMAKYMKKNHKIFDNWVHAVIAYNMGATGAKNYIKKQRPSHRRKKRRNSMKIGGDAPQYIIHFLAHKIAFEKAVGKKKHPKYKLHIHKIEPGGTLKDVAEKYNAPLSLVCEYNKWLKCDSVPHNKSFNMIVPISRKSDIITSTEYLTPKIEDGTTADISTTKNYYKKRNYKSEYPIIKETNTNQSAYDIYIINGKKGIVGKEGMTLAKMASIGNIGKKLFLEYNEIDKTHKIIPGQVYYFEPKGSRVGKRHYIAKKGDTWWSISQKFGINKNTLIYKNNRSNSNPKSDKIKEGRLLWLKYLRPKNQEIEYVKSSSESLD